MNLKVPASLKMCIRDRTITSIPVLLSYLLVMRAGYVISFSLAPRRFTSLVKVMPNRNVPIARINTYQPPDIPYLVYVYVDKTTDRIVASTRLSRFLNKTPVEYELGQEVELIVARRTDLGYNVIVNNSHEAIIYRNEIFQPIIIGQHLTGYIKTIREDGKIDCILQKNDGHEQIDRLAALILKKLEENGGSLAVSDKSDPDEIYRLFGCSKKNYKKTVGGLFKQHKVIIGEKELKLKMEN